MVVVIACQVMDVSELYEASTVSLSQNIDDKPLPVEFFFRQTISKVIPCLNLDSGYTAGLPTWQFVGR